MLYHRPLLQALLAFVPSPSSLPAAHNCCIYRPEQKERSRRQQKLCCHAHSRPRGGSVSGRPKPKRQHGLLFDLPASVGPSLLASSSSESEAPSKVWPTSSDRHPPPKRLREDKDDSNAGSAAPVADNNNQNKDCDASFATLSAAAASTTPKQSEEPPTQQRRACVVVMDKRRRRHRRYDSDTNNTNDVGRFLDEEEEVTAETRLAQALGVPILVVARFDRHRDGGKDDDDDIVDDETTDMAHLYTHELRYIPWSRTGAEGNDDDGDGDDFDGDRALELRTLGASNNGKSRRNRNADSGLSMVVDWVSILYGASAVNIKELASSIHEGRSGRPGKDKLVQAVWGGRRGAAAREGVRRIPTVFDDPPPADADTTAADSSGIEWRVADLTAGWGTDALTLLMTAPSNNCRVLLVERDPIVAAMLNDAHRRLQKHEEEILSLTPAHVGGPCTYASRITILHGDGAEVAARCATEAPTPVATPDVVYLDPMFPPRTKSAAVKKPMQVLHSLLATSSSPSSSTTTQELKLLEAARQWARERVVVKRPAKAEPLGGTAPTFSLVGGNHRWDVYLTRTATSS